MLIGLTGGIASGKSTAARFFREAGAEVIDADRLARSAVEPGRPALEEIRAEFGPSVILPDGTLDRAALAAKVFGDEEARARLNRIVHPRVEEEVRREVSRIRGADPGAVIVYDIPLLYEGGLADRFDAVVVIYVPREEQLRRLRARDGLSAEEAAARLASQMDIEEKARRADFVVENTASPEDLRRRVELLLKEIRGDREN
ncbi:MAG: dephospho-CoA kinase [Deltaproteobacteria bacterium]|nr:dephospho-CoA kinase [Deltaproteobacteria bacterium]